jgi:hypothetical protein
VCTYVVPGSTLSAAFLSSINLSVPIYASLSLSHCGRASARCSFRWSSSSSSSSGRWNISCRSDDSTKRWCSRVPAFPLPLSFTEIIRRNERAGLLSYPADVVVTIVVMTTSLPSDDLKRVPIDLLVIANIEPNQRCCCCCCCRFIYNVGSNTHTRRPRIKQGSSGRFTETKQKVWRLVHVYMWGSPTSSSSIDL